MNGKTLAALLTTAAIILAPTLAPAQTNALAQTNAPAAAPAQGNVQEIAKFDFSNASEAVDYKGQKALLLSKEHAQQLGRIDVRKIDITTNSKFTIEVEAAGADKEKFSIRVLPLISKTDKLPAFTAGINKQAVSPEFKTYKGDFTIARGPDAKRLSTLMLLGLRINPQGDVWVKSLRVTVSN